MLHQLGVVTAPFIVSNPNKSGDGGAGDHNCAVLQDGAGEAGDAPTSPGSRRGRPDQHDVSVEQLNIECVSDDHGPDDADERAVSGIDVFPRSSKECRRLELRAKSRELPPTYPDLFYQDFSDIAKTMAKAIKRMQAVVHTAEYIMRTRPARNLPSGRTPKIRDRRHSRSKTSGARTSSQVSQPKSLLDFPIDFATLDSEDGEHDDRDVEGRGSVEGDDDDVDDEDEEEAESKERGSGSGSDGSGSNGGSGRGRRNTRPRRRSVHRLRQWTSRERRRLAQLKQKGWNDDRIGVDLGRTASAVAQQWRKQKLSAV
ncbi:hypothetical protein KVR01_012507 [Diaporthe batatas]|uniref:uncharacterized protein n=1 Tax=Diaporthe batatas TaxID=748121 RepID=UPI001D03AF6F|nr:uncharacterized protein KVR01_012507 [Diaporthe batatas]KAG8157845.1 hypothetical protein KVR01_012507 [Diaporthe batatas]